MNGSELDKIKKATVSRFKEILKDNLFVIILTGSISLGTYKVGWSDLDLLIVVEHLDFDTKRLVVKIITELENTSGIHHGLNVITVEEFVKPVHPEILLDGKVLQALIDLRKYPERLLYSKEHLDLNNVYSPDDIIIRAYSLLNIGMFLRRNRQTLTRTTDHSIDELKELLKKEMRAAMIITKLAVQYFTAIPQGSYQEVLNQAKSLFPDFNFEVIEDNFRIIEQWHGLNDEDKMLNIFRKVDDYIERFTHYVFEKSQNR